MGYYSDRNAGDAVAELAVSDAREAVCKSSVCALESLTLHSAPELPAHTHGPLSLGPLTPACCLHKCLSKKAAHCYALACVRLRRRRCSAQQLLLWQGLRGYPAERSYIPPPLLE
eukprot:1138531-Pelagomonas_calceolata.AAC.3